MISNLNQLIGVNFIDNQSTEAGLFIRKFNPLLRAYSSDIDHAG